jgi:TP901 family phage tail tape measure protein
MLLAASRDVVAYERTVTGSFDRVSGSATDSARRQREAGATIIDSHGRIITSSDRVTQSGNRTGDEVVRSGQRQTRTHREIAEQATVSSRAQQAANSALMTSNSMLGASLTPLTAGLGLVAAGIGYAAYRGAEFDSAMSQVQAASQASASEMSQLRDAAVDLGSKTQYSAEEAAQGITEMAKAGVQTADILGGGLAGALNLAAAGQISVAEAAETGATALSVFKLEGSQMSHVADLLAAGAGKAQGSVSDLGQALNQSALIASQTGLSVEDTAGALALFASNGLIGSDAGTSFKTMLQALTPNSNQAAKAMEAIGFSAYDAQGNFVGLESVADQLKDGLSGLTEEQRANTLETIFGSDAVRAAAVLYKEGANGVTEWANKVNDSGYAQRQAAQLTDNLKGDLERLGGAFDAAATSAGSNLQGPLREVVQLLTGLVDIGGGAINIIGEIPGPVMLAVGAFTALHLLRGPLDALFGRMAVWATGTVTQMGLATGATSGFTLATGLARGAITSLIATAAPLAAIIAAAYAAKGVYDLAHAGDDARDSVKALNDEIAAAEDNGVRFDATKAGVVDLTKKVEELRAKLSDDGAWETTILGAMLTGAADDAAALEQYEQQLNDLTAANERQATSVNTLAARYKLSKEDVIAFADAHGIDLSGAVDKVQWDFQRLQSAEASAKDTTNEYALALAGVLPASASVVTATQLLGDTSGWTEEQIKTATDTITKWRDELQTVGSSFVEPLALYKSQLDDKSAKEREAAEATAAATEDSSDSWQDYVTDSSVSLDEWATALEQQIADQDAWRENIVRITQRGGFEVGQAFAAMGAEGASQTAAMAAATDEDFNRMASALIEDAKRGGAGAAAELDTQMRVMAAVGRAGAKGTAEAIAAELNIGVGTVRDIANQYGVELAEGVNPLLKGLGKATVQTGDFRARPGVAVRNADGNLYEQHQAEIAPGGAWRVWAEPETGGEAYIPLAADKRARSMQIWRETGRRLEAPEAAYFANGGFTTASDVPSPRSTAPYGVPIGSSGDATMQKGFDEVKAWLTANAETAFSEASGPLGAGAVSGQWMSLWNLVKSQIPQARINSTYRPGDPGAHGRNKAIDFGFGSGPGGAGSAGLASINRLLHDQVGANLYELIYDGIGDDRPDLKNGRPLTYNAATRAQHTNHVHAAVYHQGTEYVPETGWAYLQKGEAVIPAAVNFAAMSAPTSPVAMPGYGKSPMFGGAPSTPQVTVNVTGARISGRLEMGADGLVTLVDGRIDQAFTDQANAEHYASA